MNKAFVKEDSDNSDGLTEPSELDLELDTDDEDSESGTTKNQKNYITAKGADNLRAELRKLLYEDRPEVVRVVSWAASNGDRSENGDYIYGKRKMREIDRRIRFLQKRLDKAEVVDPLKQPKDRVLFGANVEISNEEGELKKYRIVGIDETEVSNGLISWISPVAKALLNSKVGDEVTVRTPKGEQAWVIEKVEYHD